MPDQPDDQLVKDVFAHFGLAAFQAQVLERSVETALTTSYGPDGRKLSQDELDRRLEELSGGAGAALAEALQKAGLSPDVISAVGYGLRARDQLLHGFFWAHAADFATVEGCHRMVADLTQVAERLSDCVQKVEAELHAWAASHDITAGDRDAVYRAMLERGRALTQDEVVELVGEKAGGSGT